MKKDMKNEKEHRSPDSFLLVPHRSHDDLSARRGTTAGVGAGGGGVSSAIRTRDKRFSVQEELLPVFWLSGSAALGRDDALGLGLSPWRRGTDRATLDLPGRRHSRQLEIGSGGEQRRKSDVAGGRKVPPPRRSSHPEQSLTIGFGGDDRRVDDGRNHDDSLAAAGGYGPRGSMRDDGQVWTPGGGGGQENGGHGDPHRARRRRKAVTFFIIIGIGLVVISLLLVTVALRLSPNIDNLVRKENEDIMKVLTQASAGSTPNHTDISQLGISSTSQSFYSTSSTSLSAASSAG